MTREPSGLSVFLRFYFRSGYPFMVPAVVVYGLLRGTSVVAMVWLGVACLVLSVILALFALRRARRVDSYVPPVRATRAALPSSAVIASDSRERRRGSSVVWWTLVATSTAGVAWGLTRALGIGVVDDEFGVEDLLIVVGSVLWIPWIMTFFWTRPALTRGRLLAERNPDARVVTLFLGVSNGAASGTTLRTVCKVHENWWRSRLPMHTTVVVDRAGIGFWRGWARPRIQYFVPWELIGSIVPEHVDVTEPSIGDPGLGISMDLRLVDDGVHVGWLDLEFRPTRSTFWMSFPYRRESIVEAVAAMIDEQCPGRERLFRGLSLREWKDAVEDAEAEGDVEGVNDMLAELREWLHSRGGALPADGDWLRERLGDTTR